MKALILTSLVFTSAASFSNAAAIFSPADPVIGGARIGTSFEEGVAGTAGGVNNWPGGEPPSDLINGFIGGGGEKFLNFAIFDTGIIITPAGGPSIVTSMELWVADDAVERDPASFEVWGTNAAVSGGSTDIAATFTAITVGGLALPDTRDTTTDTTGFSQVVSIGDGNAYSSYLILFPTVKGPNTANSMQLSEIQFDGTFVPEPGSASLLALSLGALVMRRKRR